MKVNAIEYDELGNILHRKDWNGTTLIDDWEYEYNGSQPHAVTDIDTNSANYDFTYDVCGNMIDRDDDTGDFEQEFDVENRLIEVKEGTDTTTFTYDANGQRMQTVRPDGTTIYTPFPNYEKEVLGIDTTIRSTYMLGGQAIAVRMVETDSNNSDEVNYIHSDHLGSNTVMTEDDGDAIVGSDALYYPFGGYRYTPTTNPDITDKGYTGHKENRDIGLTYMNARFYVSGIGRFASADTIVPNAFNSQSYNRFSYVRNQPLNFTDPTGHAEDCGGLEEECETTPTWNPSIFVPYTYICKTQYGVELCDRISNMPDGLLDDGLNAWAGLTFIALTEDGWWGDELDVLEALLIYLFEEFGGTLLITDPDIAFDLIANKYNLHCGGGPWSGDCVQGFWGYSEVFRFAAQNINDISRNEVYLDAMERYRGTLISILQGTYQPTTPYSHWASTANVDPVINSYLNDDSSPYARVYDREGNPITSDNDDTTYVTYVCVTNCR